MELNTQQGAALLATLKSRFEKHPHRHKGIAWASVQDRLDASAGKLRSLDEMERTGGEYPCDNIGTPTLTNAGTVSGR
jgi:hypothetical protein